MKSVTEYLDISAINYPNATVFEEENRSETFLSFQEKSKRIATSLILQGIFRKPVLVVMDKGIDCLISFLGIAYSGNFYTPVDLSMPVARVNKILEVLKPEVIISSRQNLCHVQEFAINSKVLIYEDLQDIQVNDLLIKDTQRRQIDVDTLYVLFTSGSTGVPKGVVISHRAVIDFIDWAAHTFNLDSSTIFGNQGAFYFDLSVLDIYGPFKLGAKTNIIPEKKFKFPYELMTYMSKFGINTILWVPSMLCNVANLRGLDMENLPPLKTILFCGEVMPNKQLNRWRKAYHSAVFANLYGPAEATDACTYYIVNREFSDDEPLPIGRAFNNTDILILTEDNKAADAGQVGELCIRGASLASGYYNNPEKTAAVFVQNPLNDCYPDIIYRSGDMVRVNEYDEIMFVSRKDFQVKVQGHRIELGEIETAASSIDDVDVAACIFDAEKGRTVLFYSGESTEQAVKLQLKTMLSDYMQPRSIIKLDVMPKNINGKIDRLQLKEILAEGDNGGKTL